MTLEQLKSQLEELTKSTWTLIDGWVLVYLLPDPLLLPKIHKLARAREAEVFYNSQVWSQVWGQVWRQVWGQVRDQVLDQVGSQVWSQVRDQMEDIDED